MGQPRRDGGSEDAPMLEPELKRPVVRARSFFGNHSLTVLIARGEVTAFGDSQAKSGGTETDDAVGRGMGDGGQAPEENDQGVTEAHAYAVDDAADAYRAQGIGDLEPEDDVAVVVIGPFKMVHEGRLEDADDLAIDVVDGGGEEEQAADDPADFADAGVSGRGVERGGGKALVLHGNEGTDIDGAGEGVSGNGEWAGSEMGKSPLVCGDFWFAGEQHHAQGEGTVQLSTIWLACLA